MTPVRQGVGFLWRLRGGAGPHRPRVARLLPRLPGGALGSLHGLQDAAVGVGGLDGPLDEAILVDAADDAVRGGGGTQGCDGGSAAGRAPAAPGPHSGAGPSAACCASPVDLGPGSASPCRTTASPPRSPPEHRRLLQVLAAPWVPSPGPIPGQVERQLVQLPRVGLGGLHQVHLAARRGEGPHLLQQRRPGPIQAGGEVLVLLGVWTEVGPSPHPLLPPPGTRAGFCMQMAPALGGVALTSLARSMPSRSSESRARVSLAACRVAPRVALSLESSCFRCWSRWGVGGGDRTEGEVGATGWWTA